MLGLIYIAASFGVKVSASKRRANSSESVFDVLLPFQIAENRFWYNEACCCTSYWRHVDGVVQTRYICKIFLIE